MAPVHPQTEEGDSAGKMRHGILLGDLCPCFQCVVVRWGTVGNLAPQLEERSFDRRHYFDRDDYC